MVPLADEYRNPKNVPNGQTKAHEPGLHLERLRQCCNFGFTINHPQVWRLFAVLMPLMLLNIELSI